MQIKQTNKNVFEIKTQDIIVELNGGVKINDTLVTSPGEYEIGGVFITGIASGDETIFSISSEGLNICFLSQIKKTLTKDAIDEADGVDILFLPAGEDDTVEVKKAVNLIQEIDPRIVIPFHMEDESEFLKAAGEGNPRREKTFKINSGQLPSEEEREIVILDM